MCLGFAPTTVWTGFPSTNNTIVGIDCTEYSLGFSGFSSIFNLPTGRLFSDDISSSMGATLLQGPHHSAQKSINFVLFSFMA